MNSCYNQKVPFILSKIVAGSHCVVILCKLFSQILLCLPQCIVGADEWVQKVQPGKVNTKEVRGIWVGGWPFLQTSLHT